MKKVTVKNFTVSSFFSRQHKLSALVDMALHFPQRHQSRFLFRSFSASFVYIAEELTSISIFSLSLTVRSKSYGFSLTKLEKLSRESEELKEASFDNKLGSLKVETY